jgi:putative CocE/NonD family hydrolase
MRLISDVGVAVPVRDGIELAADVHRPDQRAPLPALVQRVPYNRGLGRTTDFAIDVRRAVAAGYAVVVQDVRGRFGSGGTFTPFLDDGRDGADTIAWAAAQPWCDGRVAMVGGSYAGAAQWAAARERPPALRAIAPFVATADCYDDWIYRDGVFALGFNLLWAARNIGLAAVAGDGTDRFARLLAASDAMDALYSRVPLADQPALAGAAPFYPDWLAEPAPGGRWSGAAPNGVRAQIPALSIGGWYDVFQRGTLTAHRAAPAGSRLVMGPWAHGVFGGDFAERAFGLGADTGMVDVTGLQLRWLDHHVRGIANGADRDAPVRLFVMGADYWRDEPAWPPPDAAERALHLRGGGGLTAAPPGDEPEDAFRSDPEDPVPTVGGATFLPGLAVAANAGPRDQRAIEARADVLTYTTEPLTAALELAGHARAVVHVAATAPDVDISAKLVDVHPDGRAIGVADGIARARYRRSRTHPALLAPGVPEELAVDLGGTSHVVRPGHRIRLQLSGSSFPRFERNPQTGALPAETAELSPAVIRVFHDPARPSRLLLSCVERAETAERLAAQARS